MNTIESYLNRVTRFFKPRPKFNATISNVLQPLVDTQFLLSELYSYFRLYYSSEDVIVRESAGVQLDVDGEWINLSRHFKVAVHDPWFRFDDETRGYDAGYWWQPIDVGTEMAHLDDDNYRRILIARILANQWDGTARSAENIFMIYFNPILSSETYFITDDKETMDCYYAMSGKWIDNLNLEIFAGEYLPLSGYGVNTEKFVASINGSPIFGFDVQNDAIAGMDGGAFGIHPRDIIMLQ